MKTPKPSPTVADVVSCSSEDPSPSGHPPPTSINPSLVQVAQSNRLAHHGRSRNGTSTASSLKTEPSPSEPFAERQTVLMWGSTSNSNASSNRSPNTTPTSNGVYVDTIHSGGGNKAAAMHAMTMSASAIDDHSGAHQKWNGHPHKESITSAGIVYQITHLPEAHSDTYATSGGQLAHSPHHGQQESPATMHHSPQNHHPHGASAAASTVPTVSNSIPSAHHPIGSGCEVWSSPSYSQYQYFTYHHAPQHASTQ